MSFGYRLLHKLVRVFLGENYVPRAVHWQHDRIDGTDYEAVFGTTITFRSKFDGIVLNRKDLKHPNPLDDQDAYRFFLEYLDARVLRADEDISAAVQSLLKKLIPTGKYSIDIIADQLSIQRRTLQRRLKETGKTYVEILDDSRAELACEYLSTNRLPMANLAYMLGYSDQSAFNHAFRRWHGMTPRAWSSQLKK